MRTIYAILNVPRQMEAIKKATWHMSFAPAFFLFLTCFMLAFPFLYLFWTYDLSSTWTWTGAIGLRDPAADTFRAGVVAAIDTATPGMIASLLVWAFASMPSLIELAFPQIADGSPTIGIILKVCILFDYVTDLPLVWATVHGNGWYSSWGFAQLLAQGVTTAFLTVVTSLLLQVILILLGYTCLRLFLTMLIGSARGDHRGVTVIAVDEGHVSRAGARVLEG